MSRAIPFLVSVLLVLSTLSAPKAQTSSPPTTTIQSGVSGGVVGGVISGIVQGQPLGQPPRDIQSQTGRSVLRGRIVSADTGQPLRRANVRITGGGLRGLRTTLTDADGRYEFAQLPAGSFTISADKSAYATWAFGQTQPLSPGKPVVLTDNQVVENINIKLPRGAVITGRILDEFGEPVADVQMVPLRPQFINGQRRLLPSGRSAQTNDVGEYRLFGLGSGQYVISATLRGPMVQPVNAAIQGPEDRTGYAPTFYPGTADMNAAIRIAVTSGQTRSEVNFSLLATRVAAISGIVVDAEGRPFSGGGVTAVARGGTMGPGMLAGPIYAGGLFTLPNVPPGEYMLRANAPRPPPPPGAQFEPPEFSVAFVTINGEDVTGLRLAPLPPVTVTGRVSFEDPNAAQSITPSTIRINMTPINQDFGGLPAPVPSTTVHDDLTFQMKAVPGQYAVRATLMVTASTARSNSPSASIVGTPNIWTVKSVRVRGRDVIDSGLPIGADDITDIEIELTNRISQVTGQVTDSRGVAKDYVTLFFARDRNRWTTAANRYFAVGRPDQDGRFKINSLPPGEYYAIALDRADPGEYQDPDFLENLSRQAATFSLVEGESRALDLRLFTLQ